ncbi:uncharacterized protein LOC123205956 [Mangifera indica]|uniref:uncharacterized protein LOC123205956 n=1 Tax=Mangifera indica TaxID=29780 RepID=UPI001CF9AF39|nr:uncharacterized protein LOC123205956 [Mangifera indica]
MLNSLQNLACFGIQAAKLKQVGLQGKLRAIILKNCTVLAEITLIITSDGSTSVEYQDQGRIYHLLHYLSQLSSLKRVKVSGFFLKNWLMRNVSDIAYIASNHLKILYLVEMSFNDHDQTKATVKLLKLFSNLRFEAENIQDNHSNFCKHKINQATVLANFKM